MAELKTKKTTASVSKFINAIPDEGRREDARVLVKLFSQVTGKKPAMWGTAIVGYGQYHYKSERSNQEGDWPLVAFSPRKQNLTLYVMSGLKPADVKNLGPHTTSVGCLYIKRLSDVDLRVLKAVLAKSFATMQKMYPKG